MLGSKLMHFLDALDTSEFNAFSKFVRSPFFNSKSELIDLYEYIYTLEKNGKSKKKNAEKLKKEIVFQTLFPNEIFDAEKMRRLMSELNGLLKEYMVIKNIQTNKLLQKKLLIQSYNHRNLYTHHHEEITKLVKKLKQNKTANRHLDLFFLYQESYLHPHYSTLDPKLDIADLAHQHLNHFYLLSKLHLSCELLNRQAIFDTKKQILLFDEIKQVVEQQFQKENPIYKIYLLFIDLLQNGFELKKFELLEKQFLKHRNLLSKKGQFEFFLLLVNINASQVNNGNKIASQKQLKLYQWGLKSKVFLYNNRISQQAFTNIAMIATYQKKIKWSKKFIANYSKYLPPSVKETAIIFCDGYISLKEKDYQNAILLLSNYSFDKSFFDVRSKFVLIQALFESMKTDETAFPRLVNFIAAFLKYMDKKDIGNTRIQAHKNFARYTRKIARLRHRGMEQKEIYHRYGKDLEMEKHLMGRAWLLEKVKGNS